MFTELNHRCSNVGDGVRGHSSSSSSPPSSSCRVTTFDKCMKGKGKIQPFHPSHPSHYAKPYYYCHHHRRFLSHVGMVIALASITVIIGLMSYQCHHQQQHNNGGGGGEIFKFNFKDVITMTTKQKLNVIRLTEMDMEPLILDDESKKEYLPKPPRRHKNPNADTETVLEELKHQERDAVIGLVKYEDLTHKTVKSGFWNDPTIWSEGELPGNRSRVAIGKDHEVIVTTTHDDVTIDWIRVDGKLKLNLNASEGGNGDSNTSLKFVTMVVADDGLLEIGDRDTTRKVDSSLAGTARLIIADRGETRDRENDPIDIKGGVIVAGKLNFFGGSKTGHSIPREDIKAGTTSFTFDADLIGWKVGDRVLIPGVKGNPSKADDEIRVVSDVSEDGRTILLDRPLQHDHPSPKEEARNLIPVANLSRSIVVTSEKTQPISSRGHFMILHRQTGIHIEGTSFVELGRTKAIHAHTDPMAHKGEDQNTMGRYPLHFHIRGIPDAELPPLVVRHSVIEGGPKYGLVNHGGHVVAEDNVSYRVSGSHFFTENGGEIGAFKGNIAVRSQGNSEELKSRMYVFDFGHTGHGFWMTGGGVDVTGNYAFGHRQGAYVYHTLGAREAVRTVFMKTKNLKNPELGNDLPEWLHTDSVPFLFENNVGAGAQQGVEVWYHNRFSPHNAYSMLRDSVFWNIRHKRNTGTVLLPYSKNIVLKNLRLYGNNSLNHESRGVYMNGESQQAIFDTLVVKDFDIGVYVPRGGTNVVRNCTFSCHNSIMIENPTLPERSITLEGNRFLYKGSKQHHHVYMEDQRDMHLPIESKGDWSIKFEPDKIIYDGEQIYFPSQAREANLANLTRISAFGDLSAGEVWDQYGLAVGGVLAPSSANPGGEVTNGLIGPQADIPNRVSELASRRFSCGLDGYIPVFRSSEGADLFRARDGINLSPGWNLLMLHQAFLVFGDTALPSFKYDKNHLFEIHPDDLKNGFLIGGYVLSGVGDTMVRRKYRNQIKSLTLPSKGNEIHLEFTIVGKSGCKRTVPITVTVSKKAVRRGGNINSYEQHDVLKYNV